MEVGVTIFPCLLVHHLVPCPLLHHLLLLLLSAQLAYDSGYRMMLLYEVLCR